MKLMQINAVYPFGSTSKIVKNINDELIKNNIQSVIWWVLCINKVPYKYYRKRKT